MTINSIEVKGKAYVPPTIKPKAEKKPSRAKMEVITTPDGNFISVIKAVEILDGISSSVIYTAAKRETIRSIMIENYLYFNEDDITAWQSFRALRNKIAPRKPRTKKVKIETAPVDNTTSIEPEEQTELMQ